MIVWHNYFISEPIFKLFVALFRTHKLQKDGMVVFQKSEILKKNAVSERWCSDSSQPSNRNDSINAKMINSQASKIHFGG